LGGILGALDPKRLVEELGVRFDVTHGYFKRHSSCSYTHPPADAVLEIRRRRPDISADDVVDIDVATHRLAAPLVAVDVHTRLAAMFSVPYVVAVALVDGACPPEAFDTERRADPTIRRLMRVTHVRLDDELDRRLPAERPARVTLSLRDGSTVTAEVPNPVGDADYQPFGIDGITEKLAALLGHDHAAALARSVHAMPTAGDLNGFWSSLP
jgi:2-methylcitrate dehydratase PrpD